MWPFSENEALKDYEISKFRKHPSKQISKINDNGKTSLIFLVLEQIIWKPLAVLQKILKKIIACFLWVTIFKNSTINRSSHRRCSIKKGILKNFAKYIGKHLYQGLLCFSVPKYSSGLKLETRLWHGCFPVNFANLLRTPFLQNISGKKKQLFYRTPPDDCFWIRTLEQRPWTEQALG